MTKQVSCCCYTCFCAQCKLASRPRFTSGEGKKTLKKAKQNLNMACKSSPLRYIDTLLGFLKKKKRKICLQNAVVAQNKNQITDGIRRDSFHFDCLRLTISYCKTLKSISLRQSWVFFFVGSVCPALKFKHYLCSIWSDLTFPAKSQRWRSKQFFFFKIALNVIFIKIDI